MRKQLLLMLILCLSATMVWAERIDVSTARKVAENVANAGSGLRSAGDLSLVYAAAPGKSSSALRSGTVDGAVDYFVFNVPGNKGFVIVSGDDRAYPVLGQSDEGNFDPNNLPDNLRAMLAFYQSQITYAERKDLEASVNIQSEWGRYLAGNLRAASTEVLLTTARWDQGDPYNRQTPIIDGYHAVTGCVATALAIVMRYHEYPVETVTSSNRVNEYWSGLPVSYGPYEWDKMPLIYKDGEFTEEEANTVASLMWQIGANVDMGYSVDVSGANTKNAIERLNSVYGYSDGLRYVNKYPLAELI